MGLFDGQPTSPADLPQRGDTIKDRSGRTMRHKPWCQVVGAGPAGKTCKTCAKLYRHVRGSTYLKCSAQHMTGGPGTQIAARDPACRLYEANA
ncbi:MAG: hypothetical protein WC700_18560 [Gemmatimonadaceae bacterium]|jgi:hypothetical protein